MNTGTTIDEGESRESLALLRHDNISDINFWRKMNINKNRAL